MTVQEAGDGTTIESSSATEVQTEGPSLSADAAASFAGALRAESSIAASALEAQLAATAAGSSSGPAAVRAALESLHDSVASFGDLTLGSDDAVLGAAADLRDQFAQVRAQIEGLAASGGANEREVGELADAFHKELARAVVAEASSTEGRDETFPAMSARQMAELALETPGASPQLYGVMGAAALLDRGLDGYVDVGRQITSRTQLQALASLADGGVDAAEPYALVLEVETERQARVFSALASTGATWQDKYQYALKADNPYNEAVLTEFALRGVNPPAGQWGLVSNSWDYGIQVTNARQAAAMIALANGPADSKQNELAYRRALRLE
ncbi:MAG: hypothetical protein D6776_09710 [Planctomycetota bacterium]|nr:MAG: hypothetical protein D6776_09710 [Planctomycetota bacterium]